MIPSIVSWNYYNRNLGSNSGYSSITAVLHQATERIHYSLFYSPKLQNDFTIFIVHITKDVTGTMDVISTVLKTPECPFRDEEYIYPGDYFTSFVLPYTANVVGCALSIGRAPDDRKIFYFNNTDIFLPDQFTTWGFPAGLIDFTPHVLPQHDVKHN